MRQTIFLLAVTIATVPALLHAQKEAEVPPPKPPFVQPPPERSAWTIKVTPARQLESEPKEGLPKIRTVVAIDSVRYGEKKRDRVHYSNGSKEEFWFIGDYMLAPYPDGSRVGVSRQDSEYETAEPSMSPRFPGLDWLNAGSYSGVVKIRDEQCRHYVRNWDGEPWEAWIGLESGLPVNAKFGSVVHSYAFTTPPAAPPQMPEMFAKALFEIKERARRSAARAEKFRQR